MFLLLGIAADTFRTAERRVGAVGRTHDGSPAEPPVEIPVLGRLERFHPVTAEPARQQDHRQPVIVHVADL